MANENKIFDIVLYGNGLTAKSAVLSLSKLGFYPTWISNDIFDYYKDDRTTMLSPQSLDFYQEHNLHEIKKTAFPSNKIHIKSKYQKEFTVFEDGDHNNPLCYLIENNMLHKELNTLISKEIKEKKINQIIGDIKDISLSQNYSEIILKSGKKIKALLVIGADGSNSMVRKLTKIKTLEIGIKKYGLVSLVEHNQNHPNVSWQVFSKNGILAFLAKENRPNNKSVSSLIWSLNKTQMENQLNLSTADFIKNIKKEFGSYLGEFLLLSKIKQWPINRVDVPKPIGCRTVIIGDAAHSIYPLAGQGFNLAIGDITQLLKTLTWARDRGLDFGSRVILDHYFNNRKLWIRSITKLTDGLDWFFSNTSDQFQRSMSLPFSILDNLTPIKRNLVNIIREN